MNDPIADMLIRIKNAGVVKNTTVVLPYSKMKHAIADMLVKEGYLVSVLKHGKKVSKTLSLELAYEKTGEPVVNGVKRLSHSSRRIYSAALDLHPIKQNYGTLFISTPKGILTGFEAKEANVGGELLFTIW